MYWENMKLKTQTRSHDPESIDLDSIKELGPLIGPNGKEAILHLVVWNKPTDFPEDVVVRLWAVQPPSLPSPYEQVFLCRTVAEARKVIKKLAPRHICAPRHPIDDLQLVETWVPHARYVVN